MIKTVQKHSHLLNTHLSGCSNKARELSLVYYVPIILGKRYRLMPSKSALVQTAPKSTCFENNKYSTNTFLCLSLYIYIYIYIYIYREREREIYIYIYIHILHGTVCDSEFHTFCIH